MKLVIVWTAVVLLLTASVGGHALAGDRPDQGGWHGRVIVGGIVISGKPGHLAASDNRRQIKSLESEPQNATELKPGFLTGIGYTFKETGTTLSLTLDMKNQGPAFTIAQPLPDGRSVSLGAGYARALVWRNPYLTGVNRTETDLQKYFVTAGYQNGKDRGWTFSGTWTGVDVDRDTIGREMPDLQRDGEQWEASAGYLISLGAAGSLHPLVSYSRQELEGRSNSSHGAGMTLTHTLPLGRFNMETSISYNHVDYDHQHPIFGKTRNEEAWSARETVSYAGLFKNPHYLLFAMVAYARNDANIDFFDNELYVCVLGIGYNF